ncbi:efflux RND transporter periplasmic adaptor subunit [Pseudoalteromonas denitrificans]|uniref:RND family efflux transporter, MFP subunit n=1 Tax=Pseudoalteromonas denitrificans DSM 6059 TaxID=1123010 RepID=A0A1I1Q1P9_9GAMM|nr:efflux RND transporter periplasmic adaptor subunit [Pseudoalteromonas denitrificans]SFD15872.1 RND family efflux transporter, MFP subunit [Pseudoalteromonas denitrificans DSM 6059]
MASTTLKSELSALSIDRSSPNQTNKLPLTSIAISFSIILMAVLYGYSQYSVAASQTKKVNKNPTKVSNFALPIKDLPSDINQKNRNVLNNKVLDASGHIVARRIATVSSRVTGKLDKLYIEEGLAVTKNQVLAQLDDERAKISYQLALAELMSQKAGLEELDVSLKFENQKLERRKKLLKNNQISEELLENSQVKAQKIAAQIKSKQAKVISAQKQVELSLYQLNHHKIVAPFDGVVISKNAQVGELISTGSSAGGSIRTGVGTIVDMRSLEIEVEVGESYINRVFSEQAVVATLDAYPQWQIKSQVIAVIPTADRQKASIKVRIKLLEADERILPDMSVKVSFLDKSI